MAGRASIVGAAATHVGKVRDHNEDAHFFDADHGVFVVCDGMGGHAAGEVASALAIRTVRSRWESTETQNLIDAWLAKGSPDAKKQMIAALRSGVKSAHEAILSEAAADETKSGMGTTIVGGMIIGNEMVMAHAGDSRAYLVRDGISMQLTEDHTLLARLLAAGIDVDVTGEGARFRSMLTNALGIGQECKVSTFVVPLADGDRFLLCSDGVSEYVPEAEVGTVLTTQPSPARAAQKLIDLALERGGADNATAVVVRVLEAGEAPQPAEERRREQEIVESCVIWGKRVTAQQRLRAMRIAIPREIGDNERLPGHAMGDRVAWILLDGEVELDGMIYGPGALLYPESLVTSGPIREKDALGITRGDVRALAFRADDFREVCEEDTELGEALLEALGPLVSQRRGRPTAPAPSTTSSTMPAPTGGALVEPGKEIIPGIPPPEAAQPAPSWVTPAAPMPLDHKRPATPVRPAPRRGSDDTAPRLRDDPAKIAAGMDDALAALTDGRPDDEPILLTPKPIPVVTLPAERVEDFERADTPLPDAPPHDDADHFEAFAVEQVDDQLAKSDDNPEDTATAVAYRDPIPTPIDDDDHSDGFESFDIDLSEDSVANAIPRNRSDTMIDNSGPGDSHEVRMDDTVVDLDRKRLLSDSMKPIVAIDSQDSVENGAQAARTSGNTDSAKPREATTSKTVESIAKPVETVAAKPAETATAKPGEQPTNQPTEQTIEKPIRSSTAVAPGGPPMPKLAPPKLPGRTGLSTPVSGIPSIPKPGAPVAIPSIGGPARPSVDARAATPAAGIPAITPRKSATPAGGVPVIPRPASLPSIPSSGLSPRPGGLPAVPPLSAPKRDNAPSVASPTAAAAAAPSAAPALAPASAATTATAATAASATSSAPATSIDPHAPTLPLSALSLDDDEPETEAVYELDADEPTPPPSTTSSAELPEDAALASSNTPRSFTRTSAVMASVSGTISVPDRTSATPASKTPHESISIESVPVPSEQSEVSEPEISVAQLEDEAVPRPSYEELEMHVEQAQSDETAESTEPAQSDETADDAKPHRAKRVSEGWDE